MISDDLKITFSDELYGQYNWFNSAFLPKLQESSDEFFLNVFKFKLISLSKNINVLFQGSDYFVTKIRLDKQHDVFIRCSQDSVAIILDRILGKSDRQFDLSKISDVEAKIITAFNDYIYNKIAPILLNPNTDKRKDFDTINLTFFIQDIENLECAKIIISLPKVLLSPDMVQSQEDKFSRITFKKSRIDVRIKAGTTKFPVCDLKNLEKDDIVVFDNSNLQTMKLIYDDFEKDFRITPNPALIMAVDNNNGGNNMDDNTMGENLWDSIQVEMGAEFEKVKISLGDLKDIEEGLVVDISSVYNNKISLKVENKIIANGELVIINDRYGVKIDEVFASGKIDETAVEDGSGEFDETEDPSMTEVGEDADAQNTDEEFDYSDFELDDEDI